MLAWRLLCRALACLWSWRSRALSCELRGGRFDVRLIGWLLFVWAWALSTLFLKDISRALNLRDSLVFSAALFSVTMLQGSVYSWTTVYSVRLSVARLSSSMSWASGSTHSDKFDSELFWKLCFDLLDLSWADFKWMSEDGSGRHGVFFESLAELPPSNSWYELSFLSSSSLKQIASFCFLNSTSSISIFYFLMILAKWDWIVDCSSSCFDLNSSLERRPLPRSGGTPCRRRADSSNRLISMLPSCSKSYWSCAVSVSATSSSSCSLNV